jgi:hypothetical protein
VRSTRFMRRPTACRNRHPLCSTLNRSMGPVRTITLFAPPPRPGGGSSSWAVSAVVHAGACAWIFYGLAHTPHMQNRTVHQRFTVRVLDVPMTKPQVLQYARSGSLVHPAVEPDRHAARPTDTPAASASAAASAAAQSPPRLTSPSTPVMVASAPPAPVAPATERPAPALPAAIQLAQKKYQQQTLIQPDAPKDMILQHPAPVPLVMMWTQQEPPKPAVASPPPKPVIANLHSSIARPNRESAPAPINLSSTTFHSAMPTLAPGTTSPVVVRGPEAVKQMPVAAAQTNTPPAPVRIISLSDRQQQEGPVAVPLANASARPSASQSLTAGKAEGAGGTGNANAGGRQQSANSTTQNPGSGQGSKAATSSQGTSATGAAGGGSDAAGKAGPSAQAAGPGIGSENAAAVKRITLPKDGQFGVVVVGSSLADQYPETAAIWAGRLVYTVYLHVGIGKSWILQYSVPPNTTAAASGARPDAPWPYDIVVPRLDAADYNSDALMVHGFVNVSGKFERLNMVLPPEFAQSKFVLNALEQWQFRPARQNGQTVPVEILLIIPEQEN